MKPSLDKLYKFFKLEIERGCDNHAVVGGLERMLDRVFAALLTAPHDTASDIVPQDALITRPRRPGLMIGSALGAGLLFTASRFRRGPRTRRPPA